MFLCSAFPCLSVAPCCILCIHFYIAAASSVVLSYYIWCESGVKGWCPLSTSKVGVIFPMNMVGLFLLNFEDCNYTTLSQQEQIIDSQQGKLRQGGVVVDRNCTLGYFG